MDATKEIHAENLTEYVTVMIAGQLFGLSIARVQDVFRPERMTRIPLASAEIAGVLNLRGRIVTAVDLRCRLGLAPRESDRTPMAIGIEFKGESYGLLIDAVGEVMKLDHDAFEPNPVNLDPRLSRMATGVYRLDGQLLVILDVDRVLDMGNGAMAA
jgi:purine-binding chemotaxis protein CheW